MSVLSNYGDNIIGSEILKISGKIKSKQFKVYNYTIGDFDPQLYPIPEKLTEYIEWNFNISNTNYPSPTGELYLRESVSEHIKRKHDVNYLPNEIVIGAGVRPLIYTALKTIVDIGDNIVFPTPSWNNNHYTFLHGGNPIKLECLAENDFFPTIEQIKENITQSRLICLCSPQNPTGKVIKPEILKEICDIIVNENIRRMGVTNNYKPVYLLFDQIYSDLSRVETYHPAKLVPQIKDFLICVDGISKSLSATGVRVGWLFGPERIVKKLGEIFSHIGAWANKPEQIGLAKYLSYDIDSYHGIDKFLSDRNKIFGRICNGICDVIDILKSDGYNVDYKKPDGGIYISLYIGYYTKFKTLEDMLDFLIDDCKVGLVPFEYFGSTENSGWFRLSIGNISHSDLSEHQDIISNMIKNLDNY
jgi:aspartate aminotransferase